METKGNLIIKLVL